jgi:cardiolipin synthase
LRAFSAGSGRAVALRLGNRHGAVTLSAKSTPSASQAHDPGRHREPRARTLVMNLANILTILRIIAVPIVIVLIGQQEWLAAFVLFVAAGVTDAIDGWIARTFNQRTELGAYLDPLADKALLVSIYVTLALQGIIPTWLAVLVVSRDVMIIGAVIVSWLVDRPVEIAPLMLSKANTVAQISFAALKLGALGFSLDIGMLGTIGVWLVTALTLASIAAYLAAWLRHMTAS